LDGWFDGPVLADGGEEPALVMLIGISQRGQIPRYQPNSLALFINLKVFYRIREKA
jgi:hypothetical protein